MSSGSAESPSPTSAGLAFRIVEADETDAESIARMIRDAFGEYEGTLDPPSSASRETAETIREKMRSGGALIAFAEGRGDPELIGCMLFRRDPESIHLSRLAVARPHRGARVAAALMDAGEAIAAREGRRRARLGVRVALPELLRTYERRGYAIVERHRHEGYAEPTYASMEKRIANIESRPRISS